MSNTILVFGFICTAFAAAGNADILHALASPNAQQGGSFGISVSGLGDVNGDGYDDIVVGALCEDSESDPATTGRVYVFEGRTGTLLYTLDSPDATANGSFGISLGGGVDVNNDGYNDVAVGAAGEKTEPNVVGAGHA